MAQSSNFKTFNPVAQLLSSSPQQSSGNDNNGSFLPLSGGTLNGNLNMASSAKIKQSQKPTEGNDLTNKTYTDGAYQAKKTSANPGNIAFFGNGEDEGQVVDSGYSVDTNLSNPPSNTTLWPSSRTIGSMQYGANIFKSTAPLNIESESTVRAFSSGNENMGPDQWSNIGSTFNLSSEGIATIYNSLEYTVFYRIIYSVNSLSESNNGQGTVKCQIQNEDGPTFIGNTKFLKCLAEPPNFSNSVYMTCLVAVQPSSEFKFSIALTNNGSNAVTVDPEAPDNSSILVIERIS